jgi:hypothetical protein
VKREKEKRRPTKTTLRNLRLLREYHVAAFYAKLLETPFWFWESRRGCLLDLIENELDDRDDR